MDRLTTGPLIKISGSTALSRCRLFAKDLSMSNVFRLTLVTALFSLAIVTAGLAAGPTVVVEREDGSKVTIENARSVTTRWPQQKPDVQSESPAKKDPSPQPTIFVPGKNADTSLNQQLKAKRTGTYTGFGYIPRFDEQSLIWPAPPNDPRTLRWDRDFELMGGWLIQSGVHPLQWNLFAQLQFVDARGPIDALEILTSFHLYADANFSIKLPPMTKGKNAKQWKEVRVEKENTTVYRYPRPVHDYTPTVAMRYNGAHLWSNKSSYSTNKDWNEGKTDWFFVRVNGKDYGMTLDNALPQHFGAGYAIAPKAFADQYLGGRQIIASRGGYRSGQGSTLGPSALAVSWDKIMAVVMEKHRRETATASALAAGRPTPKFGDLPKVDRLILADYGWGDGVDPKTVHHRPPDYESGLFSPKPEDRDGDGVFDYGYMTINGPESGPAWVDHPQKRGVVYFVNQGRGPGNFKYIGGHIGTANPHPRVLIVDPMQYAEVAQGKRKPHEVRGVWYGHQAKFGPDRGFVPIGASWLPSQDEDEAGYLLVTGSEWDERKNKPGFRGVIAVYRVKPAETMEEALTKAAFD